MRGQRANQAPIHPAPEPPVGVPKLDPACATLENSLVLSPVAERTVEPRKVWLMDRGYARAPVGIVLYRVLGKRSEIAAPDSPVWNPVRRGDGKG